MRRDQSSQRRSRQLALRPFVERVEERLLLATFIVNTTADTPVLPSATIPNPLTLREAIVAVNMSANSGPNSILFQIPAQLIPGVVNYDSTLHNWRIAVATPLPPIGNQVSIDGYSQDQSAQNALLTGFNAKVSVILDGSVGGAQTSFAGLTLRSSLNRIRGLAIDGFSVGIDIQTVGAFGNLIQGNYLGQYLTFGSSGIVAPAGVGNGVGIQVASLNNTVGGVAPETHNGIAGNVAQGVHIEPGATGNQVAGNLIGVLEVDGSLYYQLGNGAEGVLVESSSNAIGGAIRGGTNVISANGSYGVHIRGVDAVRNRVQGNYIGTDTNGTFVFGQGIPANGRSQMGNSGDGIFIEDSGYNLIGISGAHIATFLAIPIPNVISGNLGAGVRITGSNAKSNIVFGNYIGTDLVGNSVIPNAMEGVAIHGASGTRVGGLNNGDENVISGNLRGVLISGSKATTVIGNLIGVNGDGAFNTGQYDLGNTLEGVRIENSQDNVIGGVGKASNQISGNNVGIAIIGSASTRNSVLGNFIGTDISGLLEIGNSQEGVRIEDASLNTIGSATTGERNVISANHWGVVITGLNAQDNLVQGNLIGTGVDGTTTLGNEVDGVLITNNAANNRIGGLIAAQGNTIGYNVRDGVRVESIGSTLNTILSNSIFTSGELGINLVSPLDLATGVTPDQSGGSAPGPNQLLNSPKLVSVVSTSTGVTLTGTYTGTPNSTYTIQAFSSVVHNPSGSGEGQSLLGTTKFTTDSIGQALLNADFPSFVSVGQLVTATVTVVATGSTGVIGNTSEFSNAVSEQQGNLAFSTANFTVSEGDGFATITVVRTGDSGGFASVDYLVSSGTAKFGFVPSPDANYTLTPGATLGPATLTQPPFYFIGTLVFNAGETTKTFQIPLLDDTFPGPTKTVNLSLQNLSGAVRFAPNQPATATLSIQDNDLPGVFRFAAASYVVNEAQGSITITVARDTPGIPVTVDYATGGGTAVPGVRYTPVSGTLSFAQGETTKTFTIPIIDNSLVQGDQTVNIVLSSPTGGGSIQSPNLTTLTIQDDLRDRTSPTVTRIQLITNRRGLTSGLILTFSKPLDPITAMDLVNYGYSVRTAGRDHQFGTRDDLLIPFSSAVYNPANLTVTLTLARMIHPPTPFRLAINESTNVVGAGRGVADLAGNLLVGNQGSSLTNLYVVVLSGKTDGPISATNPAHPTPTKPRSRATFGFAHPPRKHPQK